MARCVRLAPLEMGFDGVHPIRAVRPRSNRAGSLSYRLVSPKLDRSVLRGDKHTVNTEVIKKQITGPGPFLIRTSDGNEYAAPHSEFVGYTRHYLMIEDAKGGLDIVDPLHVVSIRPADKRRTRVAV